MADDHVCARVDGRMGEVARARQRLIEAGCLAAAMSGSGPTIFGVCESRREAEQIAKGFPECSPSTVSTVPAAVNVFISRHSFRNCSDRYKC